ncbi:polysaccharide pyruvyl transferase family protein [Paenibacillus barengoltzii]|uniref:Polysaccharide pyruvyl transferase domain-containing protein n=1 Tax=Paenibacillus barengoltzii G22 TaxID=1235795 RepID=R9LE79_9BACL|nr:polysaccharide pyruvyl transferase family protein [Paenibacillus barengoltzii]EOS54052.1 hypothetical protein C812_03683 [Paenibacillus barengoltzii G22]
MAKLRYIQCGAEYRISPSRDPYENYVSTGLNTGNLYIGYAVHTLFNTRKMFNLWAPLTEQEVNEIKSNFDIIVMGASNFINSSTDFGVPADNLNKLKLPIIVLGIGAQAPNETIKKIPLTKGTERFLNSISEYSNLIGVRGEYTAELLEKMGIRNFQIIGCPTYYINKNINYKIYKSERNFNELKIALNYTNISQRCDEKILKFAYENDIDIIGQTEYVEEYWKRSLPYNFSDEKLCKKTKDKEKLYTKILKRDINEVKEFMRNHFDQYYDIDQWIQQIKKYNFVFGTRFHGNMIAVQNSIPSLLVTHDSRTKELAEFCNIPYITANNLVGDLNLERLYNEMDYSKFNLEYPTKFKSFLEFLKNNGVLDIDELIINSDLQNEAQLTTESIKSLSIMDSYISEVFATSQILYRCPLENIAALNQGPCVDRYTLEIDGLHIKVVGTDPMVILPNFVNYDKTKVYVKIQLTAPANTVLEIFYEEENGESQYPYSESRKVSNIIYEGKNEIYLAIEADAIIKSLRLDIGNTPGEYVLHSLEIRA